jgi:hypothetical protein
MENTVSDNTMRFPKIPAEFLNSPGESGGQQTVTAQDFHTELTRLLNSKCQENASNTPNFILANFMLESLETFNAAVKNFLSVCEAERQRAGEP